LIRSGSTRAPKRGFEYEGDDKGEGEGESLKSQIRREMIEKLAAEWNELNSKLEERSFRSREERDDEADFLADQAENYADDRIGDWVAAQGLDASVLDESRRKWPTEVREQYEKLKDEYFAQSKSQSDDAALRMQVVEELIGELGGRMMRPYEHWNEEEHLMEYAERDRGDDRDDY
jgi:hypothetical protein